MIDEFLLKTKQSQEVTIPATKNIFKVDGIILLDKNKAELFHTTVAIGLLLFKRARLDIQSTIAVLFSIVKHPNQVDCKKPLRLKKYLLVTQELCLTFKGTQKKLSKIYVYAAYAVHLDFKLHTVSTLTMVKGAVIYVLLKKLNKKSSTKIELVGADDASSIILCSRLFLGAQYLKPNKSFYIKKIKVLYYYSKTVKII